jgi:NADPH:quinone reductase-like Zn-dependent oxidoreductase
MTPNAQQHPPAGGDPNHPATAGSTTVVAGRDPVADVREPGAEKLAAVATIRAMKAAVHTRYGPPEVVRISDLARPTLENDEVLVNVHATTVNRTDCGLRSGRPFIARLAISGFAAAGVSGSLAKVTAFLTGLVRPHTTVLGNEFAGVVEAVGGRVTSFAVGDQVFGYSGDRFGAHAEYLSIPAGGPLATMPSNLTYEQIAASTEGAHYALSWIRAAKIHSGQDVLVNGATGAIGSAAVQLVKSLGATVTGVCDTKNLRLVTGLGADRVIDYTAADFTTDEQTYDVVLDAVGKSSFGSCKRLLKPGGIYLSSELGRLAQNPVLALVTPLFGGKRVMFPIPKHDQQMVRYFKELIESGQFTPVIDRRYPLDQIVEAYRYVETGQKIGNVVISVKPSN